MPFYYDLEQVFHELYGLGPDCQPTKQRAAQGLLDLDAALSDQIPAKTLDETLLLATWNIREFDAPAYGERLPESMLYIAEIISRFDLVAIQEVRRDTGPLDRLVRILGRWWDYLVTDVTLGDQGNKERMAFVYDKRKVRFGGLAGEVVIPPVESEEDDETVYTPSEQLARTPYLCGFEAGWFKFMLSTVHIFYGEGVSDDPRRVREIRQIAEMMAAKTRDEHSWAKNLVLLGDFNIFRPEDVTYQALLEAGFSIPDGLQHVTNTGQTARFFDQMAFLTPYAPADQFLGGGAFNFYDVVFREDDYADYHSEMGQSWFTNSNGRPRDDESRRRYFRTYWRTHQMSDHVPLWAELKIDFGRRYLEGKAAG